MMREYYVYGWFNLEWGVYFYIGRGKGNRYKSTNNRSKAFKAIVSRWECEPSDLKAMAQAEGIAAMPVDENGRKISKKTGRGFGRPEKKPDNFADILRRQKEGLLTVKEAMAEAGVGRTRWYELAHEASL